MAYLYRRPSGRIEIREAYSTERGPRSRTLVSFQGTLEPEHLERAEARAQRPIDRAKLLERARQLGIPVRASRADANARALLADLRRGDPLDPRLATLLIEAIEPLPREDSSEEFAEVAEWVGSSDAERGEALRDVLRLYGTIAESRDVVRERPVEPYPRFRSREPEEES
jgi:hypothetical protein